MAFQYYGYCSRMNELPWHPIVCLTIIAAAVNLFRKWHCHICRLYACWRGIVTNHRPCLCNHLLILSDYTIATTRSYFTEMDIKASWYFQMANACFQHTNVLWLERYHVRIVHIEEMKKLLLEMLCMSLNYRGHWHLNVWWFGNSLRDRWSL